MNSSKIELEFYLDEKQKCISSPPPHAFSQVQVCDKSTDKIADRASRPDLTC